MRLVSHTVVAVATLAITLAVMVGGLGFLSTPLLAGDSLGTQVTVANAGRQPLELSVEAVVVGDGQRFTLTAKRPPKEKPPQLAGRLMVFDDKTPIINCELEQRLSGREVSYSFFVSAKFVEDSILTITVIGENKLDLPGGERYWFYLKDLVEMATAVKSVQPRHGELTAENLAKIAEAADAAEEDQRKVRKDVETRRAAQNLERTLPVGADGDELQSDLSRQATGAAKHIDPVIGSLPARVVKTYQALFPGHQIWQASEKGKGEDAEYELIIFDPTSTGVRTKLVDAAVIHALLSYKLILKGTGEVIREEVHPIAEDTVPKAVKDAFDRWKRPLHGRSFLLEWMAHQEKGAERHYSVSLILSAVEGYKATLRADGTFVKGSTAFEKDGPKNKELQGLLDFLKAKAVELRHAETKATGSYIQHVYSVGPDHKKRMLVGLNYLPPLTAAEVKEQYQLYSIPSVKKGAWALFCYGGRNGNATDEYKAVWEKVEAAFQAYPGFGERDQ